MAGTSRETVPCACGIPAGAAASAGGLCHPWSHSLRPAFHALPFKPSPRNSHLCSHTCSCLRPPAVCPCRSTETQSGPCRSRTQRRQPLRLAQSQPGPPACGLWNGGREGRRANLAQHVGKRSGGQRAGMRSRHRCSLHSAPVTHETTALSLHRTSQRTTHTVAQSPHTAPTRSSLSPAPHSLTVVANDLGVAPHVKLGADRQLVASSRQHHWAQAVTAAQGGGARTVCSRSKHGGWGEA
jgi:hypothetical protein